MLANVMFYGFLVLVIVVFFTENGAEVIGEAILKGLLKVASFAKKARNYFTGREDHKQTKIEQYYIEMKENK